MKSEATAELQGYSTCTLKGLWMLKTLAVVWGPPSESSFLPRTGLGFIRVNREMEHFKEIE